MTLKQDSGTPLVVTVICAIVAAATFAISGFVMAMNRRRVAKLEAKLAQAEEDRIRGEEQSRLAANKEKKDEALANILRADSEIHHLGKRLDRIKDQKTETLRRIHALTDWDDLTVVSKKNSGSDS